MLFGVHMTLPTLQRLCLRDPITLRSNNANNRILFWGNRKNPPARSESDGAFTPRDTLTAYLDLDRLTRTRLRFVAPLRRQPIRNTPHRLNQCRHNPSPLRPHNRRLRRRRYWCDAARRGYRHRDRHRRARRAGEVGHRHGVGARRRLGGRSAD